MTSLFGWVIQTSIFASVVGAIIFILKSTILKKLPAAWQYALWLVMLIKLIFPKGPQSSISVFNGIDVGKVISENELLNLTELAVPISKTAEREINIFACIYLAVFLIMLTFSFISYIVLMHKIHVSSAAPTPQTVQILDKCKSITGVNRHIVPLVQSHVGTTSLCGVFKPKILITADFEKADESHIAYTFIHELSHYRRRDIATNYLLILFRCIHWFNPVIWFLFKKIRRDMELAADEKTMLYINPSEKNSYGMALINTLSINKKTPAILCMASHKTDIKKRITAIAKFKEPNFVQHISGALTVVFIAAVCLTSAAVAEPIGDMIYKLIPAVNTSIVQSETVQAPPEVVEKEAVPEPVAEEVPEPEPQLEKPKFTVEYTPVIYYNSDNTESQSLTYKTDDTGEISFMVRTKSVYDHELAINVSNVKTPGQGWDFRINTKNANYLVPEQFEPNEEYIITVNAYCPGHYGIDGEIYIH